MLQSGVDLTNVKMSMNPFCEIAVEVSDWLHQAYCSISCLGWVQLAEGSTTWCVGSAWY